MTPIILAAGLLWGGGVLVACAMFGLGRWQGVGCGWRKLRKYDHSNDN